MKLENKTLNENDKENQNLNNQTKNISEEEKINFDYLDNKYIEKNKENKYFNNPKLNYDYGDNANTKILNEITKRKIKVNAEENLDNIKIYKKYDEKYNTDKIKNINMTYDDSQKKYRNSNSVKTYDNLYKEFKRRYNNTKENYNIEDKKLNNNYYQQNIYKNYIDNINSINRNYLTLNAKHSSNNTSYNLFEKEIKSPLNFYDFKINSFKKDLKKEQVIYLEKKLEECEKEKNNYMNQINIYKNNLLIISEFFSFISENFNQDFFPKNETIQIDNENSIYGYFKKLKEYISGLNKEVKDYKYKYEKLLNLDSNIHNIRSLSSRHTLNVNRHNREFKTQNNSFSDFCDNEGNLNIESNIYKSLEKRVLLIEKELFEKSKEKGIKIRTKSSPRLLSTTKKESKDENNKNNETTKEKSFENFMSQPPVNSYNKKRIALFKNKNFKNGIMKKKKK
jgi:hypothetical protein